MNKKLAFLLCVGVVALISPTAFGLSYDILIAVGSDDAEQHLNAGMDITSTDIELPLEDDGTPATDEQLTCLRFIVPATKGAMITNAYVEWTCDETKGGSAPVNLIIEGQLAANPATFTTAANDLTGRAPWTKAQVAWTVENWTAEGQKSRTPNLAAILQEIVNQSGWASGNALVLAFRDDKSKPSTGIRCADAYNDSTTTCALLHIEVSKAPAAAPSPAAGAADVMQDATLSWTAGQYAATHDVYFGTDSASVTDASRANPLGVLASQGQDGTTFDPAGLLPYGQTYYWRIDEVNGAPDNTIVQGGVWSFTVEPYSYALTGVTATASSAQDKMGPENTVNGTGLTGDQHDTDPLTMWLSTGTLPNWIQYEFDAVYNLDKLLVWNSNQSIEAFIGFGAKDVTIEYSVDGTTWTALAGAAQFAQAGGLPTYTAGTTISFGGVMAKYVKLTINNTWSGQPMTGLSEVRFFYVPAQASSPQPANAATDVPVDATLTWRPGRDVASHKVFLGTDQAAVAAGTGAAQTVTDLRFAPSGLKFSTTYYWKVDEVGAVTTPGAVWSFTTQTFAVVDGFESYNDDDNRIYDTWIDGLTDGKSGSQVGYNTSPFAELTTIHGGQKSMPFLYNNAGAVTTSETTRTFAPAQDFTRGGAKTLVLFLYGDPANTGGQVYVKINGTKVVFNAVKGVTTAGWTQWNINLASTGANVKAVTKLTLGVEGTGKGQLLFDDLLLYADAPIPAGGATLDLRIAAGPDDAEEHLNAGMDITSSDLEIINEDPGTPATDEQLIGMRWLIPVAPGTAPTNAYIEFQLKEISTSTPGVNTAPVNLIIEGQLAPNPAAFTTAAKDITNRPRTKAQVKWTIPTGMAVGDKFQTPDISPIIAELMSQNGWASGNALVIILRDDKGDPSTGLRCTWSYNGNTAAAPLLHLEMP